MADLNWYSVGKSQPLACDVGNVTLYKFPDGHASCAVDGSWVSALFASPEAALSWADDWDGAEKKFRELNPPTGKGENLVQERVMDN